MEELNEVIGQIEAMKEEKDIPKNVKAKLQQVITILKSDEQEASLRIDRALGELEEASDDVNIPSDIRMDLFNLSSLLENIRS